jgi:hypothetical protein
MVGDGWGDLRGEQEEGVEGRDSSLVLLLVGEDGNRMIFWNPGVSGEDTKWDMLALPMRSLLGVVLLAS